MQMTLLLPVGDLLCLAGFLSTQHLLTQASAPKSPVSPPLSQPHSVCSCSSQTFPHASKSGGGTQIDVMS